MFTRKTRSDNVRKNTRFLLRVLTSAVWPLPGVRGGIVGWLHYDVRGGPNTVDDGAHPISLFATSGCSGGGGNLGINETETVTIDDRRW